MTAGDAIHATVITVDDPGEVAAGTEFVLTVALSCPAGCDLSGLPVEVVTPDGATIIVKSPLASSLSSAAFGGESGNEQGEGRESVAESSGARRVGLKAPLRVGEHTWRFSCPTHESNGAHHEAGRLRLPVSVRPHETSLAVWAIPSPVVTGRPFAIKVGAKSAAGCDLAGMPIAVRDEAGAELAAGRLGEEPWPGTSALYWTELKLIAPADAGMFSWSVQFAAAAMALPHCGASSRFSIAIVEPPEHKLTVKVVDQKTASPVENAQVRLGAYRAATDGSGVAELMVPKGSYELDVWKPGYEAPATTIAIDADLAVEIEIAPAPEENPDAAWQM